MRSRSGTAPLLRGGSLSSARGPRKCSPSAARKAASAKEASSRVSSGPFSSPAPDGRTRRSGASASRAARAKPAMAAGAGAESATSASCSRPAAASSSRTLRIISSRPRSRETAVAGRRDQTAATAPLMDHLFVAVLLALELDGGVLDGEFLAEDGLRLGEDLVVAAAVGPIAGHHDVAAQCHQPAGDGPDVQVVDGGDARHLGQRPGDFGHRDVAGGALQQHVPRLAAGAGGGAGPGAGDEEADDGIGGELARPRTPPRRGKPPPPVSPGA